MIVKLIKIVQCGIFTFIAKRTLDNKKSKIKVNFYSRFTKNTVVGDDSHFNGMIIRGNGLVSIGDHFHSGKDNIIINSYHQYDFGNDIPYDNFNMINKPVFIEDFVWLGDRVIILGGLTIGEGAIIQAGSVVSSNIPKYSIAGGNPAKVFKYRDVSSFNNIKKDKYD